MSSGGVDGARRGRAGRPAPPCSSATKACGWWRGGAARSAASSIVGSAWYIAWRLRAAASGLRAADAARVEADDVEAVEDVVRQGPGERLGEAGGRAARAAGVDEQRADPLVRARRPGAGPRPASSSAPPGRRGRADRRPRRTRGRRRRSRQRQVRDGRAGAGAVVAVGRRRAGRGAAPVVVGSAARRRRSRRRSTPQAAASRVPAREPGAASRTSRVGSRRGGSGRAVGSTGRAARAARRGPG